MGNFIKELTELFWSENTLQMGFVKFFTTFVILFIAIKLYVYLIEKDP
tara:strand:- start:2458 stop:2601 length:144 start_codon:yes stop_codon:yes gene_type:complete